MNQEIKICQNCKAEFVIEPDDSDFYEKMKVPAPTFCPECRFQRRVIFRNERNLYKRKCDLCGKDIISVFSPDKPYKVYCGPCWWSDKWDGLWWGKGYDPSRNFFEQFREIQKNVPCQHLIVDYPTLVNSEYVNLASHLKNCYLIFDCDYCENVNYFITVTASKDLMDGLFVSGSELCYEIINGHKLHNVFFSEDCVDSYNIYFSKNLSGCSNCFGCINLRNKQYHIFNKPYTKEEYRDKFKEFKLDSFSEIEKIKKDVYKFWQSVPHKFIHERHNTNVSGDYIYESKNVFYMWLVRQVENGKFCQRMLLGPVKDVYDYTEWGNNAQRIYDCVTVGEYVDNIKFSHGVWRANSMNVEYSMAIVSSQDIFGCVGLRKKQYCILNKQYSKEEYEKLRAKIIQDMNERPYVDSKGRIFKYGEFLPYDLSLYDYNESTAMDYFPLAKEKILEKGWRWREPTPNEYKITIKAENLADSIHDIQDGIINEIIECSECKRAYRIIRSELELLRRFGLPLPRLCPECRHRQRLARINPPKFWNRQCAKCGKGIITSYAPNRPEIIYCTDCYQKEFI